MISACGCSAFRLRSRTTRHAFGLGGECRQHDHSRHRRLHSRHDGMRIVFGADMSPHHIFWSSLMQLSITGDVFATLPTLRLVAGIQHLERKRGVASLAVCEERFGGGRQYLVKKDWQLLMLSALWRECECSVRLDVDWSVAHATRSRECSQEGGECGYYHLHGNLNQALLLHCLSFSLVFVLFCCCVNHPHSRLAQS